MNEEQERYACTAVVGEKGQIVIPKRVRELLDIRPGDTLLLFCDKKQGLAIPPKTKFDDVYKLVLEGDEK